MALNLGKLVLLVGTLVFTAACGDSSGPGQGSIRGAYTLVSFNGSAVPASYVQEGVTIRVNSGSLTLNSGNTFSTVSDLTVLIPGQPPLQNAGRCSGTFTQNGMSVLFRTTATSDCEASSDTGSWDGADTITLVVETLQFVFRK